MDSAVVGPIAGRQQINGQRGEQWPVAGRLAERVPSVVAHMDDAVEGLLRADGDVHQIALALRRHSRVKLKTAAEVGPTGEGGKMRKGRRRRMRRQRGILWSTNCLTLWGKKRKKLTVSRWQIRFIFLCRYYISITGRHYLTDDLICGLPLLLLALPMRSITAAVAAAVWSDHELAITVTVSLRWSVPICQWWLWGVLFQLALLLLLLPQWFGRGTYQFCQLQKIVLANWLQTSLTAENTFSYFQCKVASHCCFSPSAIATKLLHFVTFSVLTVAEQWHYYLQTTVE